MDRKRGAIESDHGLGHEFRAVGQFKYRVRDATPHPGEVGIGPLPREISLSAGVAVVAPEHQPASLHGSDSHEPTVVLPDEDRMLLTRGAQRDPRLTANLGSINGSCGGRAR